MKKSSGVSLISLVIAIVVIIILLGISIYNGINQNLKQTSEAMDYNEILQVSEAVNERALFHRLNASSYALVGDNSKESFVIYPLQLSGEEEIKLEPKEYFTRDGWYLVQAEDMGQLNLENVRREYLVNYETGEVVSSGDAPIEYEGKYYYSSIDVKDKVSGSETGSNSASFDETKGVNRPIVSSGMIPVKRDGTSWVVTTIDDPNWYDYASDSSGNGNLWANVMMLDDMEVVGYTNEQLRTADISEIKGKVVTSEGSSLVWIPRYSVGEIGGSTKAVFSRLTTDYFKDSEALDAFRDNGVELTGIWVSKYDARIYDE